MAKMKSKKQRLIVPAVPDLQIRLQTAGDLQSPLLFPFFLMFRRGSGSANKNPSPWQAKSNAQTAVHANAAVQK